jgi:hypothetical protein
VVLSVFLRVIRGESSSLFLCGFLSCQGNIRAGPQTIPQPPLQPLADPPAISPRLEGFALAKEISPNDYSVAELL